MVTPLGRGSLEWTDGSLPCIAAMRYQSLPSLSLYIPSPYAYPL